MNVRKTLNGVIIAAWLGTAVLGWLQARWLGILTGLVCYSMIWQLGVFALGFSPVLRPAETLTGQMQRKAAWLFVASALAGTYYGGWRWGWFWGPAIYGALALLFMIILVRRQHAEAKRQRLRLISHLAEATARRGHDAAGADAEDDALKQILDRIESDTTLLAIISRHGASRERLQQVYFELIRAKANPSMAAASLLNRTSLDYLLCSPQLAVEHRVAELTTFFETGHLVYVSGPMVFTDTFQESDEAGDAVSDAEHQARIKQTATKSRSARPPRQPWWRRINLIATLFNSLCWALKRRKLDALASEGRYDELIVTASAANRFAQRFLNRDDPPSLAYLADAHMARGQYADAQQYLERAVEEARETYELITQAGKKKLGWLVRGDGLPTFEYAQSLRGLADLYFAIGDFAGAERTARETVSLFEIAKARSLSLGDEQVVVIRRWAEALDMLGDALLMQGVLPKAEPIFRRALRIREEHFGRHHLEVARSNLNLGAVLRCKGQYDAAGPLFDEAVFVLENIPRRNESALAEAVLQQGLHLQDTGEYARAQQNFQRCLTIQRQSLGERSGALITPLMHLAMVHVAQGRSSEAFVCAKDALTLLEGITEQVFSLASERQRMAHLSAIVTHTEMFASLVSQHLSHDPFAVRALLDLILTNKAIGTEVLGAQRELVLHSDQPELVAKLQRLNLLRVQIAERELARPGMRVLASAHLKAWADECEELEAELASDVTELRTRRLLRTGATEVVAGALPPDSVLIEFFRGATYNFFARPAQGEARSGAARYIAFVLLAGKPEHVRLVDLGMATPIDLLSVQFRTSITKGSRNFVADPSPSAVGATFAAGQALRERVFDPLSPAFSKTSRLFLCPDGELYSLPFEALPTITGAHLIDDYKITYLAAGRDVLRFATEPRRVSGIAAPLVVADPDYDLKREKAPEPVASVGTQAEVRMRQVNPLRAGGRKFRQLEGARQEGMEVAQLLQVSPVFGGDAREGRIKRYRSPRILHIATHGFFLENATSNERANPLDAPAPWDDARKAPDRLRAYANPMLRSGLALAGINTWLDGKVLPVDAEDGVLTAVDVSGLDLTGTEIVVLSACETGLGDARFGEGVLGLRRAFVVAGARSVVMSLWKVPDRETHILMVDFYQRLLSGIPREQALREAQLAMKENHPDPLYWGAFILQGAPGRIEADSSSATPP